MSDRRREPRVLCAFEVPKMVPRLEGVATVQDLSARGLRLTGTESRPECGHLVVLTLRLPQEQKPLLLEGVVVRHTEDGFAVGFDKVVPELAKLAPTDAALELDDVVAPAPAREIPAPVGAQKRPAGAPAPGRTPQRAAAAAPADTSAQKRAAVQPYTEILVDSCSNGQWLSGRICTPVRRPLSEFVNSEEAFVRMMDVSTPQTREPLAFVATRKESLDMILPAADQDVIEAPLVGKYVERPVMCLFPYAIIEGTVDILEKVRISDHVMRTRTFLLVRNCRVRLARGQRTPRDTKSWPLALVNTRRVLGISDLDSSPPPEEPF